MNTPLLIAVSFSEIRYANYPAWIKGDDPAIEVCELSWEKQNAADLEKCKGLMLTGGIDVDPFFYDSLLSAYPNKPLNWNRERDEFEMELFKKAQEMKLPVLGICRGLQLVNVSMGGTLLPDNEEAGKQNHRIRDGADHSHPVNILKDSLLASVSGISSGMVNSAHHQAINRPAENLLVNCISQDGIAEGIEWKEKYNRCPLLCVQWHPERMANKETSPLSKNIRSWFLQEAQKYQP